MALENVGTRDFEGDRVWIRRFFLLLFVLAVIRLAFITFSPLDLAPDEAYYRDWSRFLAWGYFSKPPMIAWINGLTAWLFGPGFEFGVRLPSVLLGLANHVAIFLLARKMFGVKSGKGAEVGFWAVAAFAATPGAVALNGLMAIDPPLIAAWCWALYFAWRALEEGGWKNWTALSVCWGLGILSKQMMMVFPPMLFIFVALTADLRVQLRRPAIYLAALGGFAFLLPNLWWNLQNGWVTVRHSADHFQMESKSALYTLLEFWGSQLGVLSPVTMILMTILFFVWLPALFNRPVWHMAVIDPRIQRSARFLVCFSGLALAVFTLMSLRQKNHPNWPAAFYPAAAILLAAWARGALPGWERRRPWFVPGVWVGAVMALFILIVPWLFPALGWNGAKRDPTRRLSGWSEVSNQVAARLDTVPNPDRTFVLATDRSTVSEMAFYLPGGPRVFRWPEKDYVVTQYELWPGPIDRLGWDALIMLAEGRDAETPSKKMQGFFERIEPYGRVYVPLGHGRFRAYWLYLGHELKGWPFLQAQNENGSRVNP